MSDTIQTCARCGLPVTPPGDVHSESTCITLLRIEVDNDRDIIKPALRDSNTKLRVALTHAEAQRDAAVSFIAQIPGHSWRGWMEDAVNDNPDLRALIDAERRKQEQQT